MSTDPVPSESSSHPLPDTALTTEPDAPPASREQVDKLVAEGKKAIALRQWDEGVVKYGEALDLMRQLVGEFDPLMAPLLLSYGKALYELAYSQQGVMGKEEVDKQASTAASEEAGPSSGNFVFSGEPASDEEDEPAEPEAEGFAAAEDQEPPAESSGDGAGAAGEGDEEFDEPEDDYNAAWEVLDVARTIYDKIVAGLADGQGTEERLCLAECYLALGDVTCETENFDQAVKDYSSALSIKTSLLPPSSRALASVHYQLATVLEFIPDGRSLALSHVESALAGFRARRAELQGQSDSSSEEVAKLSQREKDEELHDVEQLLGDLEVKIEELKAAPPMGDPVKEGIDHLLGRPSTGGMGSAGAGVGLGGTGGKDEGPVNDLTGMVKKKAKPRVKPEGKGKEVAAQVKEVVAQVGRDAKGVVEELSGDVTGAAQAVVGAAEGVVEGVQGAVNGEKRKTEQGEERNSKKARVEDA